MRKVNIKKIIKNNPRLKTALYFASIGGSIIPVGRDKKPLIPWAEFQKRRATRREIINWWLRYPSANPAMVTGLISGIIVIDIDAKHGRSSAEFDFPRTAKVRSGNNGEHLYFIHPGGGPRIKNASGILGVGVDVRGDGGYIMLPTSVNENGGVYEWILNIDEGGIALIPHWLLPVIKNDTGTGTGNGKWSTPPEDVQVGTRNDSAASMAGKILSSTAPELQETIGWSQLKVWNSKMKNPLDEKELRQTWDSIKKTHSANKGKKQSGKNLPDIVADIALKNPRVTLFKSDLDEPFIQFPVGSHMEYWSCRDKKVRLWLAQEYWNRYGKTVGTDAIATALQVLEGIALYKGKQITLSNRVAEHDGHIYWSLSNPEWEGVRVNDNNWEVVSDPPILFRRYSHQMAQVLPAHDGDISNIFKYINVKNEDERILLSVWLVSCFVPGFPHPIIYFYGPQGSAKSTASRILKRIIDPSKIEVSEMPKDQKDLVQKLSHHWFIMFDNISSIGDELSDIMCRAVTGSGFSKRELYSDDSDIIYTFRRCIGINGINLLASKPDLLERSILIELERVPKETRLNEKELYEDFEKTLPGILGSIFTALSKAMSIRPTIQLNELPRMADFAMWGYAIAEALGYGGKRFIDAYNVNIGRQQEQAINEDFVASFVVDLLQDQAVWEGSATELLELMKVSPDYNERQPGIPKNAQALSRQLNIVKTTLADSGISFERLEGQRRKVILRKVTGNIAPSATPLQPSLADDNF